MLKMNLFSMLMITCLVAPGLVQAATKTANEKSILCLRLKEAVENKQELGEEDKEHHSECFPISTDGGEVTNFAAPLLGPILGGTAGVAALSGLGGTSSTSSTN